MHLCVWNGVLRAWKTSRWLAVAVTLSIAVLLPTYNQSAAQVASDANMAMNDPDQVAWHIFTQISQPANNGTDDVLWETWADQDSVYTNDPANPPAWPGAEHRIKRLGPSLQHLSAQLPPDIAPGQDDVHINRAAFDYVVSNQLWYLSGLAAYAQQHPVKFPIDAIAVKARWATITPDQKSRYHWVEGDVIRDGKRTRELVGLVSLHISSKLIPNWLWATFEQVDNPGRCDYIGCHDSFGQVPASVLPNSLGTGQVYPPEERTAAVVDLYNRAGLGPEWINYRLKGTQVNFTGPTGAPTLLGNSVTEKGFVPTSSCMTCHARATINPQQASLQAFQQNTPPVSYNGVPDPAWFTGADSQGSQFLYYQTDFLWELPFIELIRSTDGGA